MKKGLALVLGLALCGSAFAKHHNGRNQADDNKEMRSKKLDFGMAGCGLGSVIMSSKNDKTSQIVAATTNGTFWSDTFGATFGTSNCDPKQALIPVAEMTRKNTSLFVAANRNQLELDVARMNGETLAGISEVMGCSDTQKVGSILHQNYNQIFAANSDVELGNQIVDSMINAPSMRGECRFL